MAECSEEGPVLSLLPSACSFADYVINKGGYLVFCMEALLLLQLGMWKMTLYCSESPYKPLEACYQLGFY